MKKKKLLTDKSGTLYDEMMEQSAKRLAEDIDAQIIRSMFKESGWQEVVLEPMTFEQGCEIDDWVEEHITGEEWHYGLVWMFKNPKDANWFSLRWLS